MVIGVLFMEDPITLPAWDSGLVGGLVEMGLEGKRGDCPLAQSLPLFMTFPSCHDLESSV